MEIRLKIGGLVLACACHLCVSVPCAFPQELNRPQLTENAAALAQGNDSSSAVVDAVTPRLEQKASALSGRSVVENGVDTTENMIEWPKITRVASQDLFRVHSLGQKLGRGKIVILTSERRLFFFTDDDVTIEFPIGVARRNLQRLGVTQVKLKRREPTWVPTALQHRVYRNLPSVVPPGPDNPLGTRALNLGLPNIRIHGTNDDGYIGEARSDGCFRMYNRDIEYIFDLIEVGAQVIILR